MMMIAKTAMSCPDPGFAVVRFASHQVTSGCGGRGVCVWNTHTLSLCFSGYHPRLSGPHLRARLKDLNDAPPRLVNEVIEFSQRRGPGIRQSSFAESLFAVESVKHAQQKSETRDQIRAMTASDPC